MILTLNFNKMLYNFSKEYLKEQKPHFMVYSYQGLIDHSITTEILTVLKTLYSDNPVISKKIYIVANELLENSIFHSKFSHEEIEFFILDKKDAIRVIVVNISNLADYERLINKTELLNDLSQNEVREIYRNKLVENTINKKGTIGVGLNLIRLRTNNKIIISVEVIEEKYVVIVDIKIKKK